ncbi:hypothetical protein JCM10213_005608 [Rhodosporidiobolus nylandii]
MPLPLRLTLARSVLLAVLLPSLASARTSFFDDDDALILYTPSGAWSTVDAGSDWRGGGAARTSRSAAQMRVTFAGEQISLYGSSTADFTIAFDGATPSSPVPAASSSTGSTSPQRLFVTSGLDQNEAHVLVLELASSGTLSLDYVAVAYSDSTTLTPQLLANGTTGALSTATISSSSPSSSVVRSSSAASFASSTVSPPSPLPSSTPAVDSASSGLSSAASSSTSSSVDASSATPPARNGPRIAGGIIGGVAAGALLVFLLLLFLKKMKRRGQSSSSDSGDSPAPGEKRSSYLNAETGRRRSTPSAFFGFARPMLSPLPFARSSSSNILGRVGGGRGGTDSPYNAADGGVGRSPHPFASPAPGSFAPAVGSGSQSRSAPTSGGAASETWAQRLTRAASWKRKADRLASTREFYCVPEGAVVAAVAGPRPPPPSGPLPSVPGREREMEERWRTQGPSLVQGGVRREPEKLEDYQVVHVYGEAMSDYSTSPSLGGGEAGSTATGPTSGRRSLSSANATSHLRRRSLRQEEPAGAVFTVPVDEKDLPRVPAAAAQGGRPASFHNPFADTRSVQGGHSTHPSDSSTALPPPSSYLPSVSVVAAAARGQQQQRFSVLSTDSSVEGATISLAQPVDMALRRASSQKRQNSGEPGPALHPDDVPLYGPGAPMAYALPVRGNSLRSLPSIRRTAAHGRDQGSEVVKPAAVARRPTLTRKTSNFAAALDRPMSPLDDPPLSTVSGYAEAEDPDVVERLSPQQEKHRSLAGLIETVESFDEALDDPSAGSARSRKGSRKDPPPGEEDRAAFFSTRERMPRYHPSGGDPRLVQWSDGSISRS